MRRTVKQKQLHDLREARQYAIYALGHRIAAKPAVTLSTLPGYSPMQIKQQIDRLVEVRQQMDAIASQFSAVLNEYDALTKEEKAGKAELKNAAKELRAKSKIVVEAETGMLEFVGYLQAKRPGVEQMLADPSSKWGEKAGNFFARIGKELGDAIQEEVERIYQETKEDLTHTAGAVTGLKVVSKTASLNQRALQATMLGDIVQSMRDWVSGGINTIVRRTLKFSGSLKNWVKGFVDRTKIVQKSKDNLLSAIKEAQNQIDKGLS
jgi:hypothetical protein